MKPIAYVLLLSVACAGTYQAVGDPILKSQVSFETGCPEEQIIPTKWHSYPEGADVTVCGQQRRYEWIRPLGKFQDVTGAAVKAPATQQ